MSTNIRIQKRKLGTTSIEVTPIGLGVMQFSGGKSIFRSMFPDLSQGQKNAIVKAALDGGINWFDTAEMYGFGWSEQGLAEALKASGKADDEVRIATKWLPLMRTASNIPRSITKRSRFLGGYTIDLYMVHQPWSFSSAEAEMKAMADLVEAGKIRSVGVSHFDAKRMRRAHKALEKRGLPLAVNQVQYSLLHRQIETDGILDTAKELGVTIIAYTPLANGLLSGVYHKNPELIQQKPIGRKMTLRGKIESSRPVVKELEEISARYNATPAEVALNWLIHFQGETVVAIPGATRVEHAEQSARAMRFRLSDDEVNRLDELTQAYR